MMPNMHPPSKQYKVEVWDIPTRFFHWSLVILIILSFITGKLGGIYMIYHESFGFSVFALLLFRVIWGFFGGYYARFSTFIKSPAAVLSYGATLFKGNTADNLGHNPLGAYSILAMLTSLTIQIGCGWFSNDDILTEGPLFYLVSKETSDFLTRIHSINQNIILTLILVHLAAISFYLFFKGENLILPMLTGKKRWDEIHQTPSGRYFVSFTIFAVLFSLSLFLVYG